MQNNDNGVVTKIAMTFAFNLSDPPHGALAGARNLLCQLLLYVDRS
jgi:hypothetical protein